MEDLYIGQTDERGVFQAGQEPNDDGSKIPLCEGYPRRIQTIEVWLVRVQTCIAFNAEIDEMSYNAREYEVTESYCGATNRSVVCQNGSSPHNPSERVRSGARRQWPQ